MQKRFGIITAAVIAAALALSGCGLGNDDSSSASASCEKGDLATITEGKLTIATGELTAKLSLKRHVISQNYAAEIAALFTK